MSVDDGVKKQFFRYGLASVVALVVDFGVLYLLVHFANVHYIWAATLAFLCGLTVIYQLSRRWVFQGQMQSESIATFSAFASIGLIGLLLTDLIMWGLVEKAKVFYGFSKIAAAGIVFLWNFSARRALVYRTRAGK